MSKATSDKLIKKRKELGMLEIRGLWMHPDDRASVREMVDHFNYVRYGIVKQRVADNIEKLTINNNTNQEIRIEGVYNKTGEKIVAGKKDLKPGKSFIFPQEKIK